MKDLCQIFEATETVWWLDLTDPDPPYFTTDVRRWFGLLVTSIFFRMSVLGGGCHGQVGGTRFQVGMTGADQHRYLRSDE